MTRLPYRMAFRTLMLGVARDVTILSGILAGLVYLGSKW